MKVSYNWLKDYVNFDLTPQELAFKLTMAGLEVEEIIPVVPHFKDIVVAYVDRVEKHPNADKLSVCTVKIGDRTFQVICGAPNVTSGQKVPFAPIGTALPNGIKIKKARIRGVESFGMICSEQELGLSDQSDGIWELPQSMVVGKDLYEQLKSEKDYILDIAITPNRPDAMSILGVAREIAAILSVPYNKPQFEDQEISDQATDTIQISIEDTGGCPRYAARVIKNVQIGPSPDWMADRLKTCGIRPINNIVDITNYVLLELGQPLHAFDLARVGGSQIIVRKSTKGQTFKTLDEKQRQLPDDTVMICDAEKPVAIGGIMGGINSEVSESTTDVLLESAYFSPARIGASSKGLNLSSEASQRFERGVDPNGIPFACDRAAFLMMEIAGGQVLKGIVDVYPNKIDSVSIPVRPRRINHLLGTNLTSAEIKEIFRRLSIQYENEQAEIPTYRPDLQREVDLIEEVARLITFEKIPIREQTTLEYDTPLNKDDLFIQFCKEVMVSLGFCEAMTNSMQPLKELEFIEHTDYIKVLNPISDDMNIMRRSLLLGLIKAAAYNIKRNLFDIRFFEIGRIFLNVDEDYTQSQPYAIAGLIHGARRKHSWTEKLSPVDFYDLKGIIEAFLSKIFLDKVEFILYSNTVYFDVEQVITLKIQDKILGHFGRIKSEISRHFDIDSDVFGFEFSVEELKKYANLNQLFDAYSKYPFVEKDLALIVDDEIRSDELQKLIIESGQPLVKDVEVFDLFRGKQLGERKKSIAFRIRFQSDERTLNEKEVSKIFNRIISETGKTYNAKLRDA